ncbi:MAG: hypothetical protein J5626_04320 [Lachnospiraceae bacterium]|nr:hypothetical protein [Lachnospiraceae bacterium]
MGRLKKWEEEPKKFSIMTDKETFDKLEEISKLLSVPVSTLSAQALSAIINLDDNVRKEIMGTLESHIDKLTVDNHSGSPFEAKKSRAQISNVQSLIYFFGLGRMWERPKKRPNMTSLKIKNGTVIFPDDWIVLNKESAEKHEFAGVVECRHHEKYNMPHFLYLCDYKYGCDYPDYFEEMIVKLCVEAYPEFQKIVDLQGQAHLVPDPTNPGMYLNLEAYRACPVIGSFHLLRDDDPLFEFNLKNGLPYDAMIIKDSIDE